MIRTADSMSSGRFSATMPPNADVLSVASALPYASAVVPALPTPHGFVCLMMAAVGPSNSATSDAAADISTMLLYESSLP